jgi:hypothetical protein
MHVVGLSTTKPKLGSHTTTKPGIPLSPVACDVPRRHDLPGSDQQGAGTESVPCHVNRLADHICDGKQRGDVTGGRAQMAGSRLGEIQVACAP